MGVNLTSQERSGTPVETRGAAQAAGIGIEDLLQTGQPGSLGRATTGIASPLQRLGTQAQQNLLSTQVGTENLRDVLSGALADPGSRTSDLFESLEPFEERQMERQTAGLREAFGQQGGRFSENLLQAETEMRGELADQFRRSREEALLEAGQLRNQALGQTIQGLLGAQQLGTEQGLQGLQQLLGFAQPGPPMMQQGILPGLIGAGANLGGAAMMSRGRGGGAGINPGLLAALGPVGMGASAGLGMMGGGGGPFSFLGR